MVRIILDEDEIKAEKVIEKEVKKIENKTGIELPKKYYGRNVTIIIHEEVGQFIGNYKKNAMKLDKRRK